MYVRRSARVILMNPDGAVLLVRSRFRSEIPGLEWAWFVPGGGLEPGESVHEAAAREIAEETGIDLAGAPLTLLAYAEGHGTLGELSGLMRDDFFLARTTATEISTAAMTEYELAALDRHRWWSVGELSRTDEPVVPAELAELLLKTLDHPGREPRRLPW